MTRQMIALRPAAYEKLKNLTAELSRQKGYKISMAAVVEAAIDYIERLESMNDEADQVGYVEKVGQQIRGLTTEIMGQHPMNNTSPSETTITLKK